MDKCNICPRKCNVDRNNKIGFCGVYNTVKVARSALHMWEEPCISGEEGSGTVFFSGCNMKCVFCQNKNISTDAFGKEITIEKLADLFLKLQEEGANNINLVTPTHYALQIVQGLKLAKSRGLTLPIIYNTSSYESIETLQQLSEVIDVWLPDFKYFYDDIALKYSSCGNYSTIAKKAIEYMVFTQPKCIFNEKGIITKGVIVRHLVLPNNIKQSKDCISYLYSTYKDKIFISIMNQYTPCTNLENYPEINRTLTGTEYDEVVNFAIDIGVENGFVQDGETAKESFIPSFDLTGII